MTIALFWRSGRAVPASVVALALGVAVPGHATAQTWDAGGATSDYFEANNWNPNGVPGASATVSIDNGALASQPVLRLGTATVTAMNISAGRLLIDSATLVATTSVSGTGRLVGRDATLTGILNGFGGTIEGNFDVVGDLNLGPSGSVLLNLAPPTVFDQLRVSGNAALDGTLVVDLTSYGMQTGVGFDVLTFGSRAPGSTFSALQVIGGTGLSTYLTYSDTAVRFNVAVPEPATWLTMIMGFGIVGGALRLWTRGASRSVIA